MDLLLSRGKFHLGTAVDDGRFGTEAQGRAGRIHRDIAAAHDTDALPGMDGGAIVVAEGLHEVVAGEEFVGGEHSVEVFTGDAHELRKTGAGAHEHGLEALFVHEGVDGDGAADDDVGFDLHAQGAHLIELVFQHLLLRETEFGNTVFEHSAGFVEGFEDGDVVAGFGKVRSAGKACRAGADNGHLAVSIIAPPCTPKGDSSQTFGSGPCIFHPSHRSGFRCGGCSRLRRFAPQTISGIRKRPVGDEPLELADGHRLELHAQHAGTLALAFLRTHAAANSRQR